MENLIDHNTCDYEIFWRKKLDNKRVCLPLQPSNQKINIIIRKNQPTPPLWNITMYAVFPLLKIHGFKS